MAKARKTHTLISFCRHVLCKTEPLFIRSEGWTNEADVVHCKMLGETLKGRKKESYKDSLLYGLPSR